jgi:hypothetical protein
MYVYINTNYTPFITNLEPSPSNIEALYTKPSTVYRKPITYKSESQIPNPKPHAPKSEPSTV